MNASDVVTEQAFDVDGGICSYEGSGQYGCNSLPSSLPISVTCAAESPATGGAIVDGYYVLTQAVLDTAGFDAACPTGFSRRGAIEVCGGAFLWLDLDQDNSSYDGTMTYSTNGNQISVVPMSGCEGNSGSYAYSATPTTFEIRGGASGVIVLTYTKQ